MTSQANKTASVTYDITANDLDGANRGQRNDLLVNEQAVYSTPDGKLWSSNGTQLVAAQNLVATFATDPLTGGITGLVGPDGETYPLTYVLAQTGIPIGLAPSGSVAANGAVTLGTAMPLTYSGGVYLYFPVGALYAASAAGYYFVVMSSTTLGTAYNNVYSPSTNVPAVPDLPTEIVAAGPGAFTGVTTEQSALYATVPGGLMGKNGFIECAYVGSHTNSAGNKTYTVVVGGTQVHSNNGTTSTSFAAPMIAIHNRGRLDMQVATNPSVAGSSSGLPGISAIDTSADFSFEIRLRHGSAATDVIVLEYAKIHLIPRA